MNDFIHGYVVVDEIEITDEYRELLIQLENEYLMEFDLISCIDKRELYYLVMRDRDRIEDTVVSGTVVAPGLLTSFASRNPEVVGVWEIGGTTASGVNYSFNKELYMPYMPDIITYNEEGEVESTVRPTVPAPVRLFAGYRIIMT